jgi:thiamine biosynthesis lipoprotein
MRRHFCLIVAFLLVVASPGRAAELTRFTFTENHMGTQFKIVLYAPDQTTAEKAKRAAFERIAALDGIMSDYRPTSELMRLCQKAGGDPVRVSDDLFTVLTRSQEVAQLSDGAFDVTVGPLVRLWRRARRTQQLPSAEELAKAKELVGHGKVRLDGKAHTVQLAQAGMQLDLGGIAKGFAADQALAVLKKHGCDRCLVAAGGDIAVSGPPPDAVGWSVAIAPLEGDKASRTLLLHDAAVSTSGDAEQFVVIDGKRYSHIVDPKTGLGLLGRMSVTVVGPNGLTVDPLTKVPAVLGAEKGLVLIDKIDGVAALVVRKTDTGLETIVSKRFKDWPLKKD